VLENESLYTFLCQDVLAPLRTVRVGKVAVVASFKSWCVCRKLEKEYGTGLWAENRTRHSSKTTVAFFWKDFLCEELSRRARKDVLDSYLFIFFQLLLVVFNTPIRNRALVAWTSSDAFRCTVHISLLMVPREHHFARDRWVVVQIQDIRVYFHLFVCFY